MKFKNLDLSKIANGALQEHFEREFERVVENLVDITTDPKKKRKITLTLDIHTDENRELLSVEAGAKSTIVPVETTGFSMMTGLEKNGNRVVSELKSGAIGQSYIDDEGDQKNDDGTEVEAAKNNVRSLYK